MEKMPEILAVLNNRLAELNANPEMSPVKPMVLCGFAPYEPNNNLLRFPVKGINLAMLRPIHVENGSFGRLCKIYFAKPKGDPDTITQIITYLEQLKEAHDAVTEIAPSADLEPQNPSNGYRTMLKCNEKATQNAFKLLCLKKKDFPSLRSIRRQLYLVKICLALTQLQMCFRDYSQELGVTSGTANVYHHEVIYFWLRVYEQMNPHMPPYYVHHLCFYLPESLHRKIRKTIRFVFSTLAGGAFTNEGYGQAAAAAMYNPTMRFPLGLFTKLDSRYFRELFVSAYHTRTPCDIDTFFVPKQRQWILSQIEQLEKSPEVQFLYKVTGEAVESAWDLRKVIKSNKFGKKENSVRVRILKHKTAKQDGTVLFHCHGGAFIMHSPDCHEIYMRSWITGLPNVTIFSVDYSLRQKYPNALQDVLDSYFWLSSGSMQVREVLGFNPSKVVVAGDSAGANLVYTLCLLLTNMHDYAKENNVPWVPPIPHSIVSVYGFYDFTTPSPIMVNSFIDLLLPPTIIRIAFGSMVEGCDEPYQRMNKGSRWYEMNESAPQVNARMMNLLQKIPLLNTFSSYDFERIRIPLFMITSEFDVCMDQNIELGRRWTGGGKLDILDDLPHGFLQFNFLDGKCKKANHFVMARIRQAFEIES